MRYLVSLCCYITTNTEAGGGVTMATFDSECETKMLDFPLSRLSILNRVLIVGSTMCGKSTAIEAILRAMHENGKASKSKRGIQFAVGFSKTERANGNLGGPVMDNDGNVQRTYALMPRFCVHDKYSDEVLQEFMDYQMDSKRAGRMKQSVAVFDDVLSQKGIKNSAILNEFMQNGRNFGTGGVFAGHSVKQLGVDARSQFHFVFCYELDKAEMHKFYELFGSRAFGTEQGFRRTWRRLTKKLGKYWALAIDLHNPGSLTDRVFKFRAPNPDAPMYRHLHICEAGFWWLQMQLEAKDTTAMTSKQLFNLADLAARQGINLGKENNATVRQALHHQAGHGGRGDDDADSVDELYV